MYKEHISPRGLAILLLRSKRRPGSQAEEAVRRPRRRRCLLSGRITVSRVLSAAAASRLTSRGRRGGRLAAAAAGNDQRLDCDQEREGGERESEGHWPHLKHMSLLILLLRDRWPRRRRRRRRSSSFLSFSVPKNAITVSSPCRHSRCLHLLVHLVRSKHVILQ